MAITDVAYQAMISTEFGTMITKSVVLRYTIRKELFWTNKKSFCLLICTPIPRRKEFLCMDARIETVPSYQDIFLIYSGNKSIISTIINVTLA